MVTGYKFWNLDVGVAVTNKHVCISLQGLPSPSTAMGGLNNRCISHSSGDYKSKVKMSAELFLLRPLLSACR